MIGILDGIQEVIELRTPVSVRMVSHIGVDVLKISYIGYSAEYDECTNCGVFIAIEDDKIVVVDDQEGDGFIKQFELTNPAAVDELCAWLREWAN